MGYSLKSAHGRKEGLTIPIRTKVFLIGSSPKSQIRSRKPGVGRRHCALAVRKKELFIYDLKSGHPTFINGQTLPPGSHTKLKPGTRLTVGPMEFIVEERHRKPKPAIPVGSPHVAPPVPMGRPAIPMVGRPAAGVVPITAALANPLTRPVVRPTPPRNTWAMVGLGSLAVFGLLMGIVISKAFVSASSTEQTAKNEDNKKKLDEVQIARRDPVPADHGTPPKRPKEEPKKETRPDKDQPQGKDGKPIKETKAPIVEKKPDPEVKKPDPELKKPDPEVKKPDPEVKKPDPEVKKPDPEPKRPDPDPTKKPIDAGGNRVAFASHVLPVLKERCVLCHAGPKKKGGLDVSTIESLLKGGETGPAIVIGNPEKSPLFMRVDDESMPPAGKPLTKEQQKLLKDWILSAKTNGFAP